MFSVISSVTARQTVATFQMPVAEGLDTVLRVSPADDSRHFAPGQATDESKSENGFGLKVVDAADEAEYIFLLIFYLFRMNSKSVSASAISIAKSPTLSFTSVPWGIPDST